MTHIYFMKMVSDTWFIYIPDDAVIYYDYAEMAKRNVKELKKRRGQIVKVIKVEEPFSGDPKMKMVSFESIFEEKSVQVEDIPDDEVEISSLFSEESDIVGLPGQKDVRGNMECVKALRRFERDLMVRSCRSSFLRIQKQLDKQIK